MSTYESGSRLINFPQPFGKYTLVSHLATGGMAYVFLAKQQGPAGFEKTCVIKRILPHLGENQEFVHMFLDEARIAAQLTHSHVVQIFDLGEIDGNYFLAMEYVDGRTLAQILRRSQDIGGTGLPWNIATRIIADAAEGLAYAHQATNANGIPLKIVHRDICPANIMVNWSGNAKILDFGIASATMKDSHTMVGTTKGRIHYMSPEQLQGHALDGRSDLFSLGVVFYEMLYGVRPFPAESVGTATIQILQQNPTPPADLAKQIPSRLRLILSRALTKNPDERWQNTRIFQQALEQFLLDQQSTCTNYHVEAYLQDLFPEESSTHTKQDPKTTEEIELDFSLVEADLQQEVQSPPKEGPRQHPLPNKSSTTTQTLPTRAGNRFRDTSNKRPMWHIVLISVVLTLGTALIAAAIHPLSRHWLQKRLFPNAKQAPSVAVPATLNQPPIGKEVPDRASLPLAQDSVVKTNTAVPATTAPQGNEPVGLSKKGKKKARLSTQTDQQIESKTRSEGTTPAMPPTESSPPAPSSGTAPASPLSVVPAEPLEPPPTVAPAAADGSSGAMTPPSATPTAPHPAPGQELPPAQVLPASPPPPVEPATAAP